MKKKLVVVGAYPPNGLGLSEFVDHIVNSLKRHEHIEVLVLADKNPGKGVETFALNDRITVKRVWEYNSWWTSLIILKEIYRYSPDYAWYNIIFSSFADKKIPAFISLAMPMLTRFVLRIYSVVTLHHILEFIDTSDSKIKVGGVTKLAIYIATKMLLMCNTLAITLNKYLDVLKEKYKATNAVKISHGFMFDGEPQQSDLSRRNMLIFGKFGSYKKVEPAIELFEKLKPDFPDLELTIAGGDHPSYKGYIEEKKKQFGHIQGVHFTGYLPEEDIPKTFLDSCMMLFPYTSNTGVSGVAHVACSYGLPLVSFDLPDMRTMAKEENIGIEFMPLSPADQSLQALKNILNDKDLLKKVGDHNFKLACDQSFDRKVDEYLEIMGAI